MSVVTHNKSALPLAPTITKEGILATINQGLEVAHLSDDDGVITLSWDYSFSGIVMYLDLYAKTERLASKHCPIIELDITEILTMTVAYNGLEHDIWVDGIDINDLKPAIKNYMEERSETAGSGVSPYQVKG